jgi:hypothetical protein
MICIVDPAFFLPCSGPKQEKKRQNQIDAINRASRSRKITILPLEPYWSRLWKDLGHPFKQKATTKELRDALDELQKCGERHRTALSRCHPLVGKVWRQGFATLFGQKALGADWKQTMTETVVAACQLSEEVVIWVRPLVGRNVTEHRVGESVLHEVTRWQVLVQPQSIGPRAILCLYNERNLVDKWTSRLDWRLPGAKTQYPFCPPANWWNPSVSVQRTIQSKPCLVDANRNGWARPNINDGRGYHWDVYIHDSALANRIGLNPINISQYGSTDRDRAPGTIHHTSTARAAQLRDDCGWTCP